MIPLRRFSILVNLEKVTLYELNRPRLYLVKISVIADLLLKLRLITAEDSKAKSRAVIQPCS